MKTLMTTLIACMIFLFSFQGVFAKGGTGDTSPSFLFSHTKAEACGLSWIFMDELIEKNDVRCSEVLVIKGFPYLRGTRDVLKMAGNLGTRYARHQWLELLRRIDLQARYLELSALPQKEIEKFCKRAGIHCIQGRIRAYVARCSAIMMGDEKRNHGYMKTLEENALEAARHPVQGRAACFENANNLDGLVTQDVLNKVMTPPRPSGGSSSSYLEQRIQRSKQAGRP